MRSGSMSRVSRCVITPSQSFLANKDGRFLLEVKCGTYWACKTMTSSCIATILPGQDPAQSRRRWQRGCPKPSSTQAAPQTAESLVDRIPSLDAATVRIKELMCSARAEVARLDPGTDMLWSSSADPTIQPEIRASERGVDVRAICPPAQISDPAHRRSVDGQLDAGVRIRVMPTPDIRLFVVDRCVAVLADHRRAGAKDALLIRDHLLVHLLRHTFETWWVHARDVGVFLADGAARPAAEVTGEERVLLHLLSDGLKDETVAKKLGISVRTVRRKMSDVSRRLPADNRFQAGVLAARRGWL